MVPITIGNLPADIKKEFEVMLTELTIKENPLRSGLRNKGIRRNIEDQWWDAHKSGDLKEQRLIEVLIGERYGIGRGGLIIKRLRDLAQLHETQQKINKPRLVEENL